MTLSVVSTLYRSSTYVTEFCRRTSVVARELVGESYEIVLVNDGSPDDSLAVACDLAKNDDHIVVVDLSRNFGHHRAMMCGLAQAKGERVFLIDVDLEEEPEALRGFWAEMESDPEIDVVVGQLREKTLPMVKKLTSDLFYVVFNALSAVPISNRDIVSRLMRREYVSALLEYGERELFFPAVWADAGFRQKRILATKVFDGRSSYTLKKKIMMSVEAITSFSSRPLVLVFYLGFLFSAISGFYILYLLIRKLILGSVAAGFTSIVAALFLIGGLIIFSVGLVGIYVAKIYTEVKSRPGPIIRRIYRRQ